MKLAWNAAILAALILSSGTACANAGPLRERIQQRLQKHMEQRSAGQQSSTAGQQLEQGSTGIQQWNTGTQEGNTGTQQNNAELQRRQGNSRRFAGNASEVKFANLANLRVAIWQPQGNGPFPLVLFSHGFHGLATQSSAMMKALAGAGYLVIAPNHRDAISNGTSHPAVSFRDIANWNENTYKDRGEDLHRLLEALSSNPDWKARIDWSKVALMGHSLGGYTVLAAAGAWPSWKLDGIKAIVAWSPYAMPLAHHGQLPTMNKPVMYQTGTKDFGIERSVIGQSGAFAKTSHPTELVDIDGANHFTWTDLNHKPEMKHLIEFYTITFLDKYVKGDPLAHPEVRQPGAQVEVK